jgi:hypothetical protein
MTISITVTSDIDVTTGKAPAAFVFSARGTTIDALSADETFHFGDFEWDFGDPDGDSLGNTTWARGTRQGAGSRNKAYGPIAAHCYDPERGTGNHTYTVTLTVRSTTEAAQHQFTVTVTGQENVYTSAVVAVGASTLPVAGVDGVPAGATCITESNLATVLASHKAANKQILLKHDDTFTASGVNLSTTGPFMIGMYGTGAKPKWTRTGTGALAVPTGTLSGVKIVDQDWDGQTINTVGGMQPSSLVMSDFLFLRTRIHNVAYGIDLHQDQTTTTIPSGLKFIDSEIEHIESAGFTIPAIGFRYAGWKMCVLGSYLFDANYDRSEHIFRCQLVKDSVISNNFISKSSNVFPGGSKEDMSIRCLQWGETKWGLTNDDVQSQFTLITENEISPLSSVGLQLTFDSGGELDNRWHDFIVEKNYIHSISGNKIHIWMMGQSHTIRNNICYGPTGMQYGIFLDRQYAGHPTACINCDVYNNTIFTNDAAPSPKGIKVDTSTGNNVKNNIVYFPSATGTPEVIEGSVASSGGNSATVTTNPTFSTSPPTALSHFALASGSSFRDFGVDVDVMRDLINAWRDQSGVDDSGALAFTTGTAPSAGGFGPMFRNG